MCHQRSRRHSQLQAAVGSPAGVVRAGGDTPASRVGDSERESVSATVSDAAAAGYLGMEELEGRLTAVWSASTRADLRAVVADLPVEWLHERSLRDNADRARRAARAGLGPHVRSYAMVMLLLVGIWLTVGLTAQTWYPWPVWPALGWGIGVVAHLRSARTATT